MRSRIAVSLIAGTVGGLVGAVLQALLIHYGAFLNTITGVCQSIPPTPADVRTLAMCVGGMIGMLLGTVDGVVEGNPRKLGIGLVVGLFAGWVLGYIGLGLGSWVFNLLGGTNDAIKPTPFAFAHQVIARTFGFAMLGLGVGVGASLGTRSPRRIWHGAIGGFVGGFIGGFIFDLLSAGAAPVTAALGAAGCRDSGGTSRLIGFTLIGSLTGFFIGLVDELLKVAWVKVLAGRNEGKDFLLTKTVSILGRDERCDVPLYGDPSIAAQHAALRGDGRRHVLIDAGTPLGTVVNGQRLPSGGELLLRDGDMIQIGIQRILFRDKATARKVGADPVDSPRSRSAGTAGTPMPSHLCPYCGSPKDAAGNCLCSTGPADGAPPGASTGSPLPGSMVPFPPGYSAPYAGAPVATPLMMVGMAAGRLIGIDGPTIGQVYSLAMPNTVLGREVGRDIVLNGDATVSRTHARIANENGLFVLYDNNSANGTFVNGQRIVTQPLSPGDIVQFGSSKFRFE